MEALDFLRDKDFLRALDTQHNKFYWVRIEILDMEESTIQSVEGQIRPGSTVNLDGNSAMRRTCNLSFVVNEKSSIDNVVQDINDIDNLIAINRKVKIYEGLKNDLNSKYDKVVWFPLGVYVITQMNVTHDSGGCFVNLTCKDKMCLLNGECAGGLPASIVFDSYDQVIGRVVCNTYPWQDPLLEPNDYTIYQYGLQCWSWSRDLGWVAADSGQIGTTQSRPQRFYDIIQTLVCNYGGESLSKIFINDIPLDLKQSVRYLGSSPLYYNTRTNFYTTDSAFVTEAGEWKTFDYNDDVGYIYTDFTYPGSLVSGIGDNIASVLEKIKNALGNYEYFYDIEGNFVFQEIKNYLNNSYDPLDIYRLDNGRRVEIASNGLSIIDNTNYEVDFYSNTKSVYTFNAMTGLIVSTSNAPNYNNIKNDFHIWGDINNGIPIHYHLVIKEKPIDFNTYYVVFLTDESGDYTGGLRLAEDGEVGIEYIPEDWRAELYLRGLSKQGSPQIRPDMYEQELLDLFDMIYDFRLKQFKADITKNPNNLDYFFDYLEPVESFYDFSVDTINPKIYSYQEDKIKRLYNTEIPNVIMISLGRDAASRQELVDRCNEEGQLFANVSEEVYNLVEVGTIGYTAQEVARDLLYQYTNYNESINLSTIPIYYLDVNQRITVEDSKSGVYGDYIIKNISMPLNAEGVMNISAVRALERI